MPAEPEKPEPTEEELRAAAAKIEHALQPRIVLECGTPAGKEREVIVKAKGESSAKPP